MINNTTEWVSISSEWPPLQIVLSPKLNAYDKIHLIASMTTSIINDSKPKSGDTVLSDHSSLCAHRFAICEAEHAIAQ